MVLIVVMAVSGALCVVGAILMIISRDDLNGRPQKERAFNLSQFSMMPVPPTRLEPIPDRSRRWQLGLGLLIYPGVVLGVSSLAWLVARY